MSHQARSCPTENELLARVAGTLPPDRVELIDTHIDECSNCRAILAEAARGEDDLGLRPVALATFAPNESVAGRYVIKRRLAAGGMGEVYEAHDMWLDELIAIKTVVSTIADNELALARLKAEMRLARRVTHKNVCRVYDLGFHRRGRDQIAFLTMELVRGTTLRRRFDEHGLFDTNTLLPIVEQIVAALGHAHAEGIVHRDLKPDNVMLVGNGDGTPDRVVVMDFGLARMALVADSQPLTPNSHTVLGTLDYMSPEQVQGKHAGPASDTYSLGIVLYELLTGRLPFEADSPLARALLRVTRRPPSIAEALPDVAPAWSECVARCLELEPRNRFETIGEIAEVLPRSPHRTRARSARTKRRWVVATAAATGVVAAVAFLAADRSRTPPTPAEKAIALDPGPTGTAAPGVEARLEDPHPADPPGPVESAEPRVAPTPTPNNRPSLARRSTSTGSPALAHAKPLTSAEPTAEAPNPSTVTHDDAERQAPAPGNALMNPFAASR